jgi:hypothetical protein
LDKSYNSKTIADRAEKEDKIFDNIEVNKTYVVKFVSKDGFVSREERYKFIFGLYEKDFNKAYMEKISNNTQEQLDRFFDGNASYTKILNLQNKRIRAFYIE